MRISHLVAYHWGLAMNDQLQDAWPRLGSVLKGAAAVLLAMVGFAAAVLVPYLHSTRAETRPRLAMVQPVSAHQSSAEASDQPGDGNDSAGSVHNHHYREAHRFVSSD